MKDQDVQALKVRSITYKEFFISISLPNPSLLNINVEDNLTFDHYSLYVNQALIGTHKDLKYFDEPTQLFQYLTQNLDKVVFEAGILKFQYLAGKWKNTRPINLMMTKEKLSPFEQLSQKLKKGEQILAETILHKDKVIFNLQQRFQQQEDNTKILKEENQTLKAELQQLKQYDNKLKKQNQELLASQENSNKFQSFKYTKSQKPDENIFAYHYNNSHRGFYHITKSTIELIKLNEGYHNFVNQFRLNGSKEPQHYHVKLENITHNNLKIGFCTQQGYSNSKNFKKMQSVYYCCAFEGTLYCNGQKLQAAEGSQNGDTVTCSANLQEMTFSWTKDNKQIALCEIPKKMRGKSIHFSIIICSAGDIVSINI